MNNRPAYWFPAKSYGWGWGPPTTWQGWVVMAIYIGLVILSAVFLPPKQFPLEWAACIVALSAVLIAICWIKGEPPRWRWGKEENDDA